MFSKLTGFLSADMAIDLGTANTLVYVSDLDAFKEKLKKYIYILIILVIALGTPEPSMIINLIFLIFFAVVMEITLLFTGAKNAN